MCTCFKVIPKESLAYCIYRNGLICLILVVSIILLIVCNLKSDIQWPSWCLIITKCTNVVVSGTIPSAIFYLITETWPKIKIRKFNIHTIRDNMIELHSLCKDLGCAFHSNLREKDGKYNIPELQWDNIKLYCMDIRMKYQEVLANSEILSLNDIRALYDIQTTNLFYRYVYNIANNKWSLNETLNPCKLRVLKESQKDFIRFIRFYIHKFESDNRKNENT